MAKKKTRRVAPTKAVPAIATAARFDGGAVKIEIVMQPKAAALLCDQVVNALIDNGRNG